MKCLLALAAAGSYVVSGCAGSIRPPAQLAGESGSALLQRAEVATTDTDHEGQLVTGTMSGSGWHTVQLYGYFRAPGLSRLEYQTPPLKGLIEVQTKDFAWNYNPRTKRIVNVTAVGKANPLRWRELQQNYRIALGPHRNVARRDAVSIDVDPLHQGNPKYRYWVDTRRNIILGEEHYRGDGKLVSQSMFRTLDFKPVSIALFRPPHGTVVEGDSPAARPMTLAELQRAVGFPLALPKWLPPGYRPEAHYLTRCEDGCGAPVALTRFTDGANTISLFQSAHVMDQTGPCTISNLGAIKDLRFVRNDTDYAVIGNLDEKELKHIALSIHAPAASTTSAASAATSPTSHPH